MEGSSLLDGSEVLALWVPGRPRTKGSLRVVNARRGVLAESVEGSKRWRQLVAYAVVRARPPGLPLTGRVGLGLAFMLPVDPTGARAGDLDKLERNILDALSSCLPGCADDCRDHAGVYVDDVQVCYILSSKDGPVTTPGVHIRVWDLSP